MKVAELKQLLSGYRDDMELYIVAEEKVGHRRILYGIHDFSDYREKVFLRGQLSKKVLARESERSLTIN
jgi:hypothetical protein